MVADAHALQTRRTRHGSVRTFHRSVLGCQSPQGSIGGGSQAGAGRTTSSCTPFGLTAELWHGPRVRYRAIRIEVACAGQAQSFIHVHRLRHPHRSGTPEVAAFVTHRQTSEPPPRSSPAQLDLCSRLRVKTGPPSLNPLSTPYPPLDCHDDAAPLTPASRRSGFRPRPRNPLDAGPGGRAAALWRPP